MTDTAFHTVFGLLDSYKKGEIEITSGSAQHYAFSNVFEVASKSAPYEKVVAGKNLEYVIEVLRTDGQSPWFACAHDEFVIQMDGEVRIEFIKLDTPPQSGRGTVNAGTQPAGRKMGYVVLRQAIRRCCRPVVHTASPPASRASHSCRPSRRAVRGEVGRHLPALIRPTSFDTSRRHVMATLDTLDTSAGFAADLVQATEADAVTGYRRFQLGAFEFQRDEYFVKISWPAKGQTRTHAMPADAFLRAMMRDVAWGFFYGWVNFDHVFGTRNHYGKVDMYAGTFNGILKDAGVDYTETFDTPTIMATFKAMLHDWTNEGFDPFAAPEETGTAFGRKHGENGSAIERTRIATRRMPGLEAIRRCATHVGQARSSTSRRTSRKCTSSRASKASCTHSTCSKYLSRSDVTWNPSVTSVCGRSLFCRPPRNSSCRCSMATTASNGSCNCPTKSWGHRRQEHRRAARPRDDARRRHLRDARRHPASGLLHEAVDAAGLGKRDTEPAAALRERLAPYPIAF